jgi:hypothetical protein
MIIKFDLTLHYENWNDNSMIKLKQKQYIDERNEITKKLLVINLIKHLESSCMCTMMFFSPFLLVTFVGNVSISITS